MKKFMLVFLSLIVFAQDINQGIESPVSCSSISNPTDFDYNLILFTKINNDIDGTVTVLACNWMSSNAAIQNMKDNFSYNSSTYNYDELNITLLDYKHASNSSFKNIGYFGEIRDKRNSKAYGFLYKGTDYKDMGTISRQTVQSINDHRDSVYSSSTYTPEPVPYGLDLSYQEAFIVSFTQVDNYANGYFSSELVYELDFDDGINWLELIKDTDRDNELVGFRYYSSLNSSTYTKFIKPNN